MFSTGLIAALKANFRACCRIVGEEFFQAMAHAYVVSQPPVSPILLNYGLGFADFIVEFEPAEALPYLPDVARIERAWTEAYHARDAVPLAAEALASISNDRVADACLAVHPALRVVRSRFPALTIWRMNVADGVPSPVDFEAGGEDALVLRSAVDVEVRLMPAGGAELLDALASGKSLNEQPTAPRADAHFDLSANLAH
jgi:hypothetical protein